MTKTKLRQSLRNLYKIIDKYENEFRPDFLQGEYSHWIADYKDTNAMDYWKYHYNLLSNVNTRPVRNQVMYLRVK